DTRINLTGSVAWIGVTDSGIQRAINTVSFALLETTKRKFLLDGQSGVTAADRGGWDKYLHHKETTPEMLKVWLGQLHEILDWGETVTLVVTNWGTWSSAAVSGEFHSFEDKIMEVLRQYPHNFTLYVFGARELAGGR